MARFLGAGLWPLGHTPCGVAMAHAGHTRHMMRVYCPCGQYAAFAGLWPLGHTPCGVAMAHAGHTRHIAHVYIFQ